MSNKKEQQKGVLIISTNEDQYFGIIKRSSNKEIS